MTENQVRYTVATGRIPVGSGVDAWGRPFWTEEEVEGAVEVSCYQLPLVPLGSAASRPSWYARTNCSTESCGAETIRLWVHGVIRRRTN